MKLPEAEKLCEQLVAELKPRIGPKSAMVGLYTGGAWLAERLHQMLGMKTPLGLMDIAFYRDDYAARGLKHDPKRTKIPFDVNGAELLLVDDVLYSGRTVRAAMNELFDYGRPQSISLSCWPTAAGASCRSARSTSEPRSTSRRRCACGSTAWPMEN